MNEFNPSEFIRASSVLFQFPRIMFDLEATPDGNQAASCLDSVSAQLTKIECPLSAGAASDMASDLRGLEIPIDGLEYAAKQLARIIADEMKGVELFRVASSRAGYFAKRGADMVEAATLERFPKAGPELEDAAKCYSLGRFTACGFHLMRACEPGFHLLGKLFGADMEGKEWGKLFDPWKEYKRGNSPSKQLERIMLTFGGFKDAWRNDLAHASIHCDEGSAKLLIESMPRWLDDVAANVDDEGNLIA